MTSTIHQANYSPSQGQGAITDPLTWHYLGPKGMAIVTAVAAEDHAYRLAGFA